MVLALLGMGVVQVGIAQMGASTRFRQSGLICVCHSSSAFPDLVSPGQTDVCGWGVVRSLRATLAVRVVLEVLAPPWVLALS